MKTYKIRLRGTRYLQVQRQIPEAPRVSQRRWTGPALNEGLQGVEEELKHKITEQNIIAKKLTESVKQLEKKICSLQGGTRLILRINEQLMRRYDEPKTVMGSSVKKLVKVLLRVLSA